MDKNTEEKVKITLDGAGITYAAKISPLIATSVLRLCVSVTSQENKDLIIPTILGTEPMPGEEKFSLGEYVNKYQPTTYPEKIIAIAAYQKELKGREVFSPEDIRPLFRTIGDVPPANFGRDFRIALANSWIAPDDNNPNAFYITSIGLKALKSNFSGGSIKKQKTRKRKKK